MPLQLAAKTIVELHTTPQAPQFWVVFVAPQPASLPPSDAGNSAEQFEPHPEDAQCLRDRFCHYEWH